MKKVETVHAVGHVLCHDLTQIIKDVSKGVRFKKGHIVAEEDIPILLSMGKEHLFIWEKQENMLHENDAAERLRHITQGKYMSTTEVKEGKIELVAQCDGLLEFPVGILEKINSLGEIMIAARGNGCPVKKGDKIAGMRVIPLMIHQDKIKRAEMIAGEVPIFTIHPYQVLKYGIVVTGSELLNGYIKDTFSPVVAAKMEEYGAQMLGVTQSGDHPQNIVAAIQKFYKDGADLVVCTGGMSVDPDDRTPGAIRDTGAKIVSYGAPVLPGAMFLLAYLDGKPLMGLPGCVMYAKRTVFDLVLPSIVAGKTIGAAHLARLGNGGLCLNCTACSYPNCGFGKGGLL